MFLRRSMIAAALSNPFCKQEKPPRGGGFSCLAEEKGFEPLRHFHALRDFESRLFDQLEYSSVFLRHYISTVIKNQVEKGGQPPWATLPYDFTDLRKDILLYLSVPKPGSVPHISGKGWQRPPFGSGSMHQRHYQCPQADPGDFLPG